MPIAAIRFCNPGNVSLPIKGWTGPGRVVGIHGQRGYAQFPTPDIGFAAMRQQVCNRIVQGYDTINKLGGSGIYENPPTQSWIDNVSKYSGIGGGDWLDYKNEAQIGALLRGICKQETGLTLAELGVGAGLAGPPAMPATPAPKEDIEALLKELLLKQKAAEAAIKAAQDAKAALQQQITAAQARLVEIEKEIG